MKAKKLIESLGNRYPDCIIDDFEVRGITCNSKQVFDNFVFVAIEGTHIDGHGFIDEAISKGAKAVIAHSSQLTTHGKKKVPVIAVEDTRKAITNLAARFYGNPSSKIKVVAVTGTNGKTTITYLIEALIKEAGFVPAVIGTVNYRFKDKIIPSRNTTPGPIELQSLLADAVNENIDYAVMEVSSHALCQDRTDGIGFHSAIFTNLTQDHLDYHNTLEDYFQAKAKLFKDLRGYFAVINNDDEYSRRLKAMVKGPAVITYGIDNEADIMAIGIKLGILHTEFTLKAGNKEIKLKTRLIGRHNIYNILASFAWAYKEGLDDMAVRLALEKFNFVPGRLERVDTAKGFSVFVDYAHTEDALMNVISALRQISDKRIIVVFGCGGERDKTKRPKMGRVVSELADYAIITNDNPRSEDPQDIIKDIRSGIKKDNYCVIPERKEAIKRSLSEAKAGDIILIAGKGHEDYQILGNKKIHFDDREAVKECLMSR